MIVSEEGRADDIYDWSIAEAATQLCHRWWDFACLSEARAGSDGLGSASLL